MGGYARSRIAKIDSRAEVVYVTSDGWRPRWGKPGFQLDPPVPVCGQGTKVRSPLQGSRSV